MGKASKSSRRDVRERPKLIGPFHEVAPVLMDFYGLTDEPALNELMMLLFGYSCRDQEGEPENESPKDLAKRRSTGHALAEKIVGNARQALDLIDKIEVDRANFEDVVLDNPALLEEIFDIDVGPPDVLFYPPELDAFKNFFANINGEEVKDAFSALAKTPVRPKLNRGRVRNVTIFNAVAACREYWKGQKDHSWSMSALKVTQTRDRFTGANLQGVCESFVFDIIHYCGIRFNLKQLVTAWTEVDKLARDNEGHVPQGHKRLLAHNFGDESSDDYAAMMRPTRPPRKINDRSFFKLKRVSRAAPLGTTPRYSMRS